jgi:hypothetical protein
MGLDAVCEADQAGAARQVGTADAVVAHREPKLTGDRVDADFHAGGVRVLGRIGQRLEDNVVGGHLHTLGQPGVGAKVERHGDPRASSERVERRSEPA